MWRLVALFDILSGEFIFYNWRPFLKKDISLMIFFMKIHFSATELQR